MTGVPLWECCFGHWLCVVRAADEPAALARAKEIFEQAEEISPDDYADSLPPNHGAGSPEWLVSESTTEDAVAIGWV